MKHSEYSVKASSSLLSFGFNSEGPKGTIKKQVSFHAFSDAPNVYNLSLADIDKSGQVNDMIASNNNDHQKILSTVALTISRFFRKTSEQLCIRNGQYTIAHATLPYGDL